MERTITLGSGECELVTRLATEALVEGELDTREEADAHAVREKIAKSETVVVL